ncbi:phosphotransferase [Intrasporangium oryzae NRRL B-24470]|uniref:Phosphotransferase n=1 Tax=Intrasporangium oryzae NRRL B-24470 TaxID=1386089 RepID=W9GEK3_9MICO|nr:AAA family ATPase [Intrasporangium oryzae]EWT03647.1 phosphotransferase [Intrasporangium oryzae NRRL B-24470]
MTEGLPLPAAVDIPQIIVVTGVMAAGKSTVSQLLAERFTRAVHLRGDEFRRVVVRGRADMSPHGDPEAERQLALRHTIAAHSANLYAAAGFTVVVQDLFVGTSLQPFLDQLTARPLSLIMLAPDVAVVMQRESERVKVGYGDIWSIRDFDHKVRSETPRIGLWLDSSKQTPDETVDELVRRLPEARIA